ncbi:hypothetical protein VCHE46_0215A, partial [Vibrio cholerae HE-46]
MFASRR